MADLNRDQISHKGKKKEINTALQLKNKQSRMLKYTEIDQLLANFVSMKEEYENGEQRSVISKVFL